MDFRRSADVGGVSLQPLAASGHSVDFSQRAEVVDPAVAAQQQDELREAWEKSHPGEDVIGYDENDLKVKTTPSGQVHIEMSPQLQSAFERDMRAAEAAGVDLPFQMVYSEGLGDSGKDSRAPLLGGGVDGWGTYLIFNQREQSLIAAGSGYLLGAAICALPVVGWTLCFAIGAIITAASAWIFWNGICPSTLPNLKFYVNRTSYSHCRS